MSRKKKPEGMKESLPYKLSDKGREILRASAKKLHEKQRSFYAKRGKKHVLYTYEDTHKMIYELKRKLGLKATLDSLINFSVSCVLRNSEQFKPCAAEYIKSISYASKRPV